MPDVQQQDQTVTDDAAVAQAQTDQSVKQAEPELVQAKDDALVEVMVDGEPVRMTWKEARQGVMRTADYTRKTQAAAAERKQLKELYDSLTTKKTEIDAKELAIDKLLGRTSGGSQPPAQLPDDEVMTVGQWRQLATEREANFAKAVQEQSAQEIARLEEGRRYEKWQELTDNTVSKLVTEYPVLADVDHLAVLLKRNAMKDSPTNEQELVQALVKAGKGQADKLMKRFDELSKAAAVKKAALVAKGPEPQGGAPQLATQKSYGKNRDIDWNELERDVIAAIQATEE